MGESFTETSSWLLFCADFRWPKVAKCFLRLLAAFELCWGSLQLLAKIEL